MPVIPQYSARNNITANKAGPNRNEVDQSINDQNKVLGTMQNIAQKMSDAHDVMQYTEAKTRHDAALMDIQLRADADQNYRNSSNYLKELQKAKDESLKGIDNQAVANKARQDFEQDTMIAGIKIKDNFFRKEMKDNRLNLQTDVAHLYQQKTQVRTEAQRLMSEVQINELLQAQVDTGLINQQEAANLKYNSEKQAFENLIYSNPEEGMRQLKDSHTTLSSEDKGKLLDDGRLVLKKQKELADWQLEQNQIQSTISLSEALHNNTLSPQMVRGMQQNGQIDSETAAIFDSIALNKTYEIPESTSLAEPDYFLRLLEDSHGDKKQTTKVLKDAAVAYGNNKIGTNQYLYFIQNAKTTFNNQSNGQFTKTKEQSGVSSALEGLKAFGDIISAPARWEAKAFTSFFDRFKPGDDPNKIKQDIINEKTLDVNSKISAFPQEGKMMVDKNGNKALVFPDGHVEEINK